MAHSSAKPSLTVTTCSSSHALTSHSRNSSSSQCSVCSVPVCIISATAIFLILIDETYQSVRITVNGSKAMCRHGTDGNIIVVLPRDGAQGDLFVHKSACLPNSNIEGNSPAPLVVSHRAIQLCQLTGIKQIVVSGRQFTT